MSEFNLDAAVRKVHDFPKKGILFYDVTSLLTNPKAFRHIIDEMKKEYTGKKISGIVAIESRGFIFGAPLALHLGVPLVLARKKGKLPGKTISRSYALEYGEATLEIHQADISAGMNLLIVDDLIATGGTLRAVADMIEQQKSAVAGIFSVIGLPFLNYKNQVGNYAIKTLIEYHGE
jgi:adenine phosphoribosyltransferase